jgi:cytochrome P450
MCYFIFFTHRFDTVAGGLGTASYLLALHPEIQEKLWREVSEAMVDGKMSYEVVNELEYLDMVISGETNINTPPTKQLKMYA